MKANYLVSGRFYVYDQFGNLLETGYFLNKVFQVDFIRAARNKALAYMKTRKSRRFGKHAMLRQVGDLRIRQYHKPLPKKKKKKKPKQGTQLALFKKLK